MASMNACKKTIFDQVRKCNRKVWGVRHALDVQFDFEKEMQEVNDLKKDVQSTRCVEVGEQLQDAINRAQTQDRQEDTSKGFDGLCAAVQGFLLDHPACNHIPLCNRNFVYDVEDDKQYNGGDDIYAHAQHIADGIKREYEVVGDSSSFTSHASTTSDKGDPSQRRSYEPSLIMCIWMPARTSHANPPLRCFFCTLAEEPVKVGWHVKFLSGCSDNTETMS